MLTDRMSTPGSLAVPAVRDQVEEQVRADAEADGGTDVRLAETLADREPRQDRRASHGCNGMGIGHECEMNIADIGDLALGGRPFDPEVVQEHPDQLHELDGDQDPDHRHIGIDLLDDKGRCGVIDREHAFSIFVEAGR